MFNHFLILKNLNKLYYKDSILKIKNVKLKNSYNKDCKHILFLYLKLNFF